MYPWKQDVDMPRLDQDKHEQMPFFPQNWIFVEQQTFIEVLNHKCLSLSGLYQGSSIPPKSVLLHSVLHWTVLGCRGHKQWRQRLWDGGFTLLTLCQSKMKINGAICSKWNHWEKGNSTNSSLRQVEDVICYYGISVEFSSHQRKTQCFHVHVQGFLFVAINVKGNSTAWLHKGSQ